MESKSKMVGRCQNSHLIVVMNPIARNSNMMAMEYLIYIHFIYSFAKVLLLASKKNPSNERNSILIPKDPWYWYVNP